jgi:hypothetical protein
MIKNGATTNSVNIPPFVIENQPDPTGNQDMLLGTRAIA